MAQGGGIIERLAGFVLTAEPQHDHTGPPSTLSSPIMNVVSITRVERPLYDDIFWAGDEHGLARETHQEPAPIEATYEVTVEAGGERHVFDAEVRAGPAGQAQVDWADGLQDLMRGLPDRAWGALSQAIYDVHTEGAASLPLDLRRP